MSEEILTQCLNGGTMFVHVKDGRITRIRPLVFDETDAPGWTIKQEVKGFRPTGKLWYRGMLQIKEAGFIPRKGLNIPTKG